MSEPVLGLLSFLLDFCFGVDSFLVLLCTGVAICSLSLPSSSSSMRDFRQALSHLRSFLRTSFCTSSSAAFLAFLCLYDSPVGKCLPFLGEMYLMMAKTLLAFGFPVFWSTMSCSISRVSSLLCVVILLTRFAMIIGDNVSGSEVSLTMPSRSSSDNVD